MDGCNGLGRSKSIEKDVSILILAILVFFKTFLAIIYVCAIIGPGTRAISVKYLLPIGKIE